MAGPAAQARPHRPLLQTIGLGAGLHQSGFGDRVARQVDQERVVVLRRAIWATLIGTAILAVPAAAEAPKYGGHPHLHDPGGCAAELRRSPREHLCDGAL